MTPKQEKTRRTHGEQVARHLSTCSLRNTLFCICRGVIVASNPLPATIVAPIML